MKPLPLIERAISNSSVAGALVWAEPAKRSSIDAAVSSDDR
jgi:hypothetical protein